MVNDKKNVLFVGAHPDDIEIGCGGILAKHVDIGDDVFVLIMTKGEMGNHHPELEECFKSLALLGVKKENIVFGEFQDGYLKDDQNSVNFIEKYIKKFNINRVYTHHPNDRHQDHRNCSNAVSAATRRNISEILLFEGPSTRIPVEFHYFVEITEKYMDQKIKALNCYQTQIEKGGLNIKKIINLAEVYGCDHNTAFAEAFALNHLFRGKNEI